jgi:hypothetical protein
MEPQQIVELGLIHVSREYAFDMTVIENLNQELMQGAWDKRNGNLNRL